MLRREIRPSLSRPIFYSAVVHLVLVIILSLSSHFPDLGGKEKLRVIWIDLPRGMSLELGSGLKEAEGLPQSTLQEQKQLLEEPAEPKALPMPLPADKKTPVPSPRTTAEDQKIKRALAALDKKMKERKIELEAGQIKTDSEGYKYGTSDHSLRIPPDDPEYVKYYAKLRKTIIDEWITAPSLLELPPHERPSAELIVHIDEEGHITSTQWHRKSGNASFDASCIRALHRASPFDIPPDRLKAEAWGEGFHIEFIPLVKPQ